MGIKYYIKKGKGAACILGFMDHQNQWDEYCQDSDMLEVDDGVIFRIRDDKKESSITMVSWIETAVKNGLIVACCSPTIVNRMERLKLQPKPTLEQVDKQIAASIAIRKKVNGS